MLIAVLLKGNCISGGLIGSINMAFDLSAFPFTAVDCRALVAPGNGNVFVGTTTLGSLATYSCDPSFRLVGMESRLCQENGTWSGEIPTCEGNVQDKRFPVGYYMIHVKYYMLL